jgi:hypothetical protein
LDSRWFGSFAIILSPAGCSPYSRRGQLRPLQPRLTGRLLLENLLTFSVTIHLSATWIYRYSATLFESVLHAVSILIFRIKASQRPISGRMRYDRPENKRPIQAFVFR